MPDLQPFLPTSSSDVVAVFDQNFNQVFGQARPMKVIVDEQAKVMEHPIETGATITDHRVILPVEIELSLIIPAENYRSVYQQIRQLYFDAILLTVQTKTASYEKMLIAKMPHDESPENFDVILMAVKMKEAQFVTAQFGTLPPTSVQNPVNASTVDKGELSPSAAPVAQTPLASAIFGRD